MSIFNIVLIGVGLAMDAFAVTIAKSLLVKDIKKKEILTIAGVFGLFQAGMPLLGWLAGIKFESYITAIDHWIAFILLGVIGGKMIYESLKGHDDEEVEVEAKDELAIDSNKNRFTLKSLFILGVATSIDALAVGVSFAFLNVSIIPAIIIIGVTTFVLCILAVYIGRIFGSLIQKRAELFGGIILVIIGTKILLEHIL